MDRCLLMNHEDLSEHAFPSQLKKLPLASLYKSSEWLDSTDVTEIQLIDKWRRQQETIATPIDKPRSAEATRRYLYAFEADKYAADTLRISDLLYHHVRIRPEDRHKTAFICHRGLFQWTRMAFGSRHVPTSHGLDIQ